MLRFTRGPLLVIAALSMLLAGLFVATASRSDAQTDDACPAGFNLVADATACFQNAASITSLPTCDVGELTPDGLQCFTDARILGQDGSTLCPDGFSPDDSLGGACARFTPATQGDPVCPTGARGEPGACYILIATGAPGDPQCTADDAALGGFIRGGLCVITGAAPTPGAGDCPESSTVILDAGSCFEVLSPTSTNPTVCPASADIGLVDGQCRRSVPLVATLECAAEFALLDNECIRYTDVEIPPGQCPTGSFQDSDGNCRRPVADGAGAYSCPDGGTLNGKSCVTTTGFTIDPDSLLYVCDTGTRALVGGADGPRPICLHDDPVVSLGVGCLQGSLSEDGFFCIVPRIDSAPTAPAPVPSFTG